MPSTTLTIDEVYGGGGNSGATYKNDYIVIHNETDAAISLDGYSVQYNSASGANPYQLTSLSGSVQAGGYYLVQEAAGTGGTTALPTADATGTLNLSGTTGKVALVDSTMALAANATATSAGVVDFVGFGTANTFEGAAAPAPSNTMSIVRANDGDTDTDNNASDFTAVTDDAVAHAPNNSQSAPHVAGGGDTTPPTLTTTTPAENANNVATTAAITLNFSEAIQLGTGDITLSDGANPNVVIAVTDATQVTVGAQSLTITPTGGLQAADAYHLGFDAGVVKDAAGNAVAANADALDVSTTGATIPLASGSQANSDTITQPGAYQLAAGATLSETASHPAISATVDTAGAATSIDVEGSVVGYNSGSTTSKGGAGVTAELADGVITVGAESTITTTDGKGLNFNAATGGSTLAVTNLGQIVSHTATMPNGTIPTKTQDSASGVDFSALNGLTANDASHTTGGTLTNGSTDAATALIQSDSADGVDLGSNQTLTNYGHIIGDSKVDDSANNNALKGGSTTNAFASSKGVEINGGSHDTVVNYGSIDGSQHGVDGGDTADTDLIVTNAAGATITGHNGSGVSSDATAAAASNVVVTNSGTITGAANTGTHYDRSGAVTTDGDGDGVDVDGGATLVNNTTGVIQGTGASGFDSNGRANHSEGVSIGGGSIDNFGKISGADYGVTVNNDSTTSRSGVADTTITNEAGGTITGLNGYAIRLENKGADSLDTDTITNHGTITGGGAIPDPTSTATIESGAADQNTVGTLDGMTYTAGEAGDARFVSGDGAAIQMGEGNDTLVNDGAIDGSATGRAISLEGGDDTLTLYAEGHVTGGVDGGAGADTLNLTAHAANTANMLSDVTNFETLNVAEGVWTVTDAESFATGTTIIAGATLQLGTGAATGAITGAITDNGTLVLDHSDAQTLDASVSGPGVLVQAGAGVLTLSGAHAFAGVTLEAGTTDVAALGGAGATAVTFAAAAGQAPVLHVEQAALSGGDFTPVIHGFTAADTLEVAGLSATATATLGANNLLTVTDGTTTDTFHLDPSQTFAGKVFDVASDAHGGVNVTLANAPSAPVVLFSNDFADFTAAGFAPGAAASTGALDSNVWRVVGLSDDANPAYGFTAPSAGDFGRGVISGTATTDTISTAGVYSPANNHALVVQPTGSELDAGGFIEAKIANMSGSAATNPTVSFDWTYRNDEPRGDDLQFSYSTDGTNFSPVAAANFSTPAAADSPFNANFASQHESVTLSGLNLAPGEDVYLRWTHLNSTGSGNRDEVGIDNVLVQAPSLTPASGSAFNVANATNVTSQAEGGPGDTTAFDFTVNRTGDLTSAQDVSYAVFGSGAHPADGADFVGGVLPTGTLHFIAGQSTADLAINVAGDAVTEPDEGFTVTLSNPSAGAQVLGAPASVTILNDDASFTPISAIQGAGQMSPFNEQTVTTSGVVTAIDTTGSKGFYIEQPDGGDGNPATSDGLFVFTNVAPSVHVGDIVSVAGSVTEYRPTPAAGADSDTVAADANNLTLTELDPTSITTTGMNGHVTPVVIGEGGLAPPTGLIASTDPNAAYDPSLYARDFYESLEGQVVTVHNAMAVDATFSGETFIVPDNGADSPALNARGGVTVTDADGAPAAAANYAPERIELYEDSGVLGGFTPAYNQGDHLGDVTGVVSYYNGNYELLPVAPPAVTTTQGPPADDVTALHGDPTHLTVGAYNVDNLGPVGSPGNPDDTAAKYAALGHDIAYNLGAPAILGLEEIQDSDGEGTGSDLTATVTLNQVTAAITAAGGPTYSSVEVAPTVANENGGAPNGNIRSAFIYDPTRVSLVAGSVRLIDDPSHPLMNSDGTFNTSGTFYHSREPLAADFTFNGQTVTVIDVHQYSRLGSDELYGVDQPPTVGGDDRRTAQADAVLHYVQGLEAANPNAQIVVEGDFNGLYFEKALTDLGQTNPATGQPTLVNLVQTLSPAERYSYNFEGGSEQLDNYLVTPNLAGGALFDDVHVNTGQLNLAATSADGSGAVSDHDPILGELTLGAAAVTPPTGGGGGNGGGGGTPGDGAPTGVTQTGGATPGQLTGTTAGDALTAGSAGDTLLGGDGADTLVTGAGHDQLFGNMGDDHIVVGASSLGATVFGGQGNDVLDASASTHAQYLSGDVGNDLLKGGTAGADTLLGGAGADTLVAGAGHELLFGNADNDLITIGANVGGAGVQAYGGQGDDVIDASHSNSANYISGDLGNDTITSGAGFESVLGGLGDDAIVGGASAGPGSLQYLFGNQGNDHLSYAGAGGVELFGGQDSDIISLTATQAGQVRYAFGNLGSDTLTATGGADSLYGGQGDDVVSAANDTVGHNYLSGDLGNDVVTASKGGLDTLHGGQGADTIKLTAHAEGAGDSVLVGAGESTAVSATDESNLQHLLSFTSGSDHILLAGHATLSVGAGGNLTTYVGGANASEAAAFAAAYTYAYGDRGASAAHVGATEYLAVQESYGGGVTTYLFTADHHAVALVGVPSGGLQGGDVLAA